MGWRSIILSILISGMLGACVDRHSATAARQLSSPKQRAEWRRLLVWDDACEQAYQNTKLTNDPGVETYILAKADELVMVFCAVGGYQPSFVLYHLKEQHPELLSLETYSAGDGVSLQRNQSTELWGEVYFRAESRVLTIVNAARQTKDCGTWADYAFSADTASLQALYNKFPCPASISPPVSPDAVKPPEDWQRFNLNAVDKGIGE